METQRLLSVSSCYCDTPCKKLAGAFHLQGRVTAVPVMGDSRPVLAGWRKDSSADVMGGGGVRPCRLLSSVPG